MAFFCITTMQTSTTHPIGVFDSGYGGLTVLTALKSRLPHYDFLYLGDNARTPYGNRSFESVYRFTLQGVKRLFQFGCPLVILACNTASAKALRTIQQQDLPTIDPIKRVLGVIRPTTEMIGEITKSNNVGVLGTNGTIQSESYRIEIENFFPNVNVWQQACPMWVPIIENNEHAGSGADYFVKKYLDQLLEKSDSIDTIILGCTHYPLMLPKIRAYLAADIKIISQGEVVAERLNDYLHRHHNMEKRCTKNGLIKFYTTDTSELFDQQASIFYGENVLSEKIVL
jgi:glutamate racemase